MYGGLSAGRELVMPKAMTTQATVFWPTVVGSRVSDLGLRQQIVCVVHACGYRCGIPTARIGMAWEQSGLLSEDMHLQLFY